MDKEVAKNSVGVFSGAGAAPSADMSFDDILGVKTNQSGFADIDMFGDQGGKLQNLRS